MTIKRGISLYSFQDEYVRGKLTVEQCVAQSAALGARGIETLAEQMFYGYPFPGQDDLPDSFYGWWADVMKRYETVATVHDMFLDTKRYRDRLLTQDEMVESLRRDIRHTAKLGANGIRLIVNTPPEVVEAAAPYARDYGVWMGVEVHSPWSFGHEWIQRHLDVAVRVGTDVVGCIPDLGIFVHRLPRVVYERALRDGADPALASEILETYDAHGDVNSLFDRIQNRRTQNRGADPVTIGLARTAVSMIAQPVTVLGEHAQFIKHIHAKFYEMVEAVPGGVPYEYSIPYPEIVAVLQESGYDGYLSSEYEGNRHIEDVRTVDSVEQLRWHQTMLADLLGEGE